MTHYVYRLFDRDGVLLYVGESKDPWKRWKAHRSTAKWARDVKRGRITVFRDRLIALTAERDAIVQEQPKHNIVHNPGAVRRYRARSKARWTPSYRLDRAALRSAFAQSGMTIRELADRAGWAKPRELEYLFGDGPLGAIQEWAAHGIVDALRVEFGFLFEEC